MSECCQVCGFRLLYSVMLDLWYCLRPTAFCGSVYTNRFIIAEAARG